MLGARGWNRKPSYTGKKQESYLFWPELWRGGQFLLIIYNASLCLVRSLSMSWYYLHGLIIPKFINYHQDDAGIDKDATRGLDKSKPRLFGSIPSIQRIFHR